jgi:hypothetical protein
MQKRENVLKKYLVNIMGTRWHVQSHEDRYSEGIPDLSYGVPGAGGWIELKQVEKWPVKAESLVKPKKFTPAQVNWLLRRGKRAGFCYILIKVAQHDFFLFNFTGAKALREGRTKDWYLANCLKHWPKNIDPAELIGLLSKEHPLPCTQAP